jgi:hypothetical protein
MSIPSVAGTSQPRLPLSTPRAHVKKEGHPFTLRPRGQPRQRPTIRRSDGLCSGPLSLSSRILGRHSAGQTESERWPMLQRWRRRSGRCQPQERARKASVRHPTGQSILLVVCIGEVRACDLHRCTHRRSLSHHDGRPRGGQGGAGSHVTSSSWGRTRARREGDRTPAREEHASAGNSVQERS